MSLDLRRFAISLVRQWTRLYTWRLPPALGDARRAEIESDLWEAAHDSAHPGGRGLHELIRLVMGIADDFAWRLEQEDTMAAYVKLRIAIVGIIAVVLVLGGALASSFLQVPPPDAPVVPTRAGIGYLPAPPFPPPPPASGTPQPDIPWTYGRTSHSAVDGAEGPTKVKDAQPVYPPIAVAYGLRGEVVIEATVDGHGRITTARVVRSIPVFDYAAINAIRRWEFEPRVVNGVPVPVTITVRATFE